MNKSYFVIFRVAPSQIQTLYFSMKLPWKKHNIYLEEELLNFVYYSYYLPCTYLLNIEYLHVHTRVLTSFVKTTKKSEDISPL